MSGFKMYSTWLQQRSSTAGMDEGFFSAVVKLFLTGRGQGRVSHWPGPLSPNRTTEQNRTEQNFIYKLRPLCDDIRASQNNRFPLFEGINSLTTGDKNS